VRPAAAGPAADGMPDVWRLMAQHMGPRAWARACGAARGLYDARVRVARARPSSTERLHGWALEQWPAAQSLFLDLRAVADLPRLPELVYDADMYKKNLSRSALMRRRWALPALEYLHVISHGEPRHEWAVRADAAEAAAAAKRAAREEERESRRHCERVGYMRMPWDAESEETSEEETDEDETRIGLELQWVDANAVAADALALLLENMDVPALRVLSLDAPLLTPLPGTLAGLQHLVLRVEDDEECSGGEAQVPGNDYLFETIADSLPALRTLRVEAANFCAITGGAQLMPCSRLEALALANVHVAWPLVTPAGCRVAIALPANAVGDLCTPVKTRAGLPGALTALALRRLRLTMDQELICMSMGVGGLHTVTLGLRRACLPALRELRIVLGARDASEGYGDGLAALDLESARLPALRVLEVDVPCALRLRLACTHELRTLVLVVHAVAGFAWEPSVPAAHPWAAIFVRTAAAPPGAVRSALRAVFRRSFRSGAAAFGEAQGGAWQCAAPAGFRPGDLRACACRACLDCLGRAGVPLAAPRAWRREGFDRLLAPLCWCAHALRRPAARVGACCHLS